MVSEVINARKQEVPLQDDNSNVFLQVMVCIAVFLFAVTLSGVLSINSMLLAWNDSILGSLTVQVMPIIEGNKEAAQSEILRQQSKAVEFLREWPGIERADPLKDKQLNRLIQPWLGDGIDVSST